MNTVRGDYALMAKLKRLSLWAFIGFLVVTAVVAIVAVLSGDFGDFEAKVEALEALDSNIPAILQLEPDVLIVAGDHSTPAVVGGHSWHPVPIAVSSRLTRGDGVPEFTERAARDGSLGTMAATSVMTLALAHGGRLNKYGP